MYTSIQAGTHPQPIVLGHEGAGVVEALGAGVRGFAVGDHVILSGSSCGRCPSCLANRPTYCDLAMPLCFGGKRLDGSTAFTCGDARVHSHFFGQSSFATPHRGAGTHRCEGGQGSAAGKAWAPGLRRHHRRRRVIEALHVGYDDSIAIFGVGGVGLSAVMAARLIGARHIIAVDVNADRLALARELGATHAFHSDDDAVKQIRAVTGRGVRFTLNTTTVPAVHTMALEVLAMNGTAAFVAAPRGPWAPLMFPMLAGGRQMRGILGGDAHPGLFLPKLIDYWRQGRFPFDRLLTFYRFDEIARAFADVHHGRVIKPVLLMEGSR